MALTHLIGKIIVEKPAWAPESAGNLDRHTLESLAKLMAGPNISAKVLTRHSVNGIPIHSLWIHATDGQGSCGWVHIDSDGTIEFGEPAA